MSKVAVTAGDASWTSWRLRRRSGRCRSRNWRHDRRPESSCHAIVATLLAQGALHAEPPRALYPTGACTTYTRDIAADRSSRMRCPAAGVAGYDRETVIFASAGRRGGLSAGVEGRIRSVTPQRRGNQALHSSSIGKAMLGSFGTRTCARCWRTAAAAVTGATLTTRRALLDDWPRPQARLIRTRGENVADVWAAPRRGS